MIWIEAYWHDVLKNLVSKLLPTWATDLLVIFLLCIVVLPIVASSSPIHRGWSEIWKDLRFIFNELEGILIVLAVAIVLVVLANLRRVVRESFCGSIDEFRKEFGVEPPSRMSEASGPSSVVRVKLAETARRLWDELFPKENELKATLRAVKHIRNGAVRRERRTALQAELAKVQAEIQYLKPLHWRRHALASIFECTNANVDASLWDYATSR